MTKQDLQKIKYYLIVLGVATSVYIYAWLAGWRIFGSNTEKWSPEGQHDSHNRSYRRNNYHK